MIEKFQEEDYKAFFEWLLEKEVHINKEVDMTLLMTNEKPYLYYPDEIKQLLETKFMQRLGRITQLGTGILNNPTTYHTRLEHGKGAGHNATKFYMYQFKNEKWRTKMENENRKIEVLADIIQMYTHDIGHNVLSHVLESLIKSKLIVEYGAAHEILGWTILNNSQEMVQTLDSINPELLDALNRVSQEDYTLKTLKEGSIDFDRLDFMIRDILYYGLDEKRELIDRLISNCTIYNMNVYNKKMEIPVFEYEELDDIEEFLEYRADYYKNRANSNEIKSLDYLIIYFCKKIANSNYDCDLKSYINCCIETYGKESDLESFLELFSQWDDVRYYNEVINIAKNCPDEELKELAEYCLPNLEGLTNLAFGLLDLKPENIDKLEGYQKDFCENVSSLVKEDGSLHRKLLAKKESKLVFLDPQSQDDVNKIMSSLECNYEIKKEKLNSLISWKKMIYKYKEPIFVKDKTGQIFSLDQHPECSMDFKPYLNCGILALPIQMKENNFTDEEIHLVQEEFLNYNKQNQKSTEKYDKKMVYEKEDIKAKMEYER